MALDGRIRVPVARTFALREAAAAHAFLDRREHVGKVVLTLPMTDDRAAEARHAARLRRGPARRRVARGDVDACVRVRQPTTSTRRLCRHQATGGRDTWWYTRLRNPSVEAVADKLALLEGADGAVLFSSGLAAVATTLLALAPPGARIVASRDLYGDVFTLLSQELTRQGREVAFVAIDDHSGGPESSSGVPS